MHANWFWVGTIVSMPLWLVAGNILGTFRWRQHTYPRSYTPPLAPTYPERWETERTATVAPPSPVVVNVNMPALPAWAQQPTWAPPVVDAEVVKELPA